MKRIRHDQFRRSDGASLYAQLGKRAGENRRAQTLAKTRNGIQRARRKLAEQRRAVQESLSLSENLIQRAGDNGAARFVRNQPAQRSGVLPTKLRNQRRTCFAI